MTADGYIAKDENHTPMQWTSPEDKKLFRQMTKAAGVVVMGRKTYDTIGAPLPGRLNIVLTSQQRDDQPNVLEHKNGNLQDILNELQGRGFKEVIVAGGTAVNTAFLKANLIDEIHLTIEPLLFGSGLRLFEEVREDKRLQILQTDTLNDHTIHIIYKVIKEDV